MQFIEGLPLVANPSKGGLMLTLVEIAVTVFVGLTLGCFSLLRAVD